MRMRLIRLDGFRSWRHFDFSKLCNQMSTVPTPFHWVKHPGASTLKSLELYSFHASSGCRNAVVRELCWASPSARRHGVIQHARPLVKLRSPWLVQQSLWTDTTFQRQQPVKCLSGACLNQLVVHGKLPFRLSFLWDGDVKFIYTWKCSQNTCANIYMCLSASWEDTACMSLETPLKSVPWMV